MYFMYCLMSCLMSLHVWLKGKMQGMHFNCEHLPGLVYEVYNHHFIAGVILINVCVCVFVCV